MDPLRGDVFSPADGDYRPSRPGRTVSRYCAVCRREEREMKATRLMLGVLVGYTLAVLVWCVMGRPC
jgi:hypothetical protein